MRSLIDPLFDFLLNLYSAFAIVGPMPGIIMIVIGIAYLFSGNSGAFAVSGLLIIAGICILFLNGYLQSIAEKGERGETVASNVEKVFIILAMLIAIVFGFVVFMAWELLKMFGKIFMDVLNGK